MGERAKTWALMEEADWNFRRLVRRFIKERDRVTIEGVALPGMLILHAIQRDGEQRLGDLAEQFDFTSGAVTAICDKLESLGFAIRQRSASDRRSVVLNITEEGRQMLNRNSEAGLYMIEILFGGFTEEELKALNTYFERLNERVGGFAEAIMQRSHEQNSPQDSEASDTSAAERKSSGTGSYITY